MVSSRRITRAAVLTHVQKPLEIWDLEIPCPKPGQVLVEIAYSGICGTQRMEMAGLKGEDLFLPHCLGHEGSGIVIETAPDVAKVRPGDHVVLSWIPGKGRNVPSTQYQSAIGTVNAGAITTFQCYAVISENRVTPISKTLPLEKAALLGCAIPTGAGTIEKVLKPQKDESLLVIGCGGVGLSAILMARFLGCEKISAIDSDPGQLELARSLGATYESSFFDTAIECTGNPDQMEEALSLIHPKHGRLALVGNRPQGSKIHIDPQDLISGKQLVGSWGGNADPDRDFARYADMFLKQEFKLNLIGLNEIQAKPAAPCFRTLIAIKKYGEKR